MPNKSDNKNPSYNNNEAEMHEEVMDEEPVEQDHDDLDEENTTQFDPEESIYELAPFVLPGESVTQDVTPVRFDAPLTEKDEEKLEKLKQPASREEQEDTIPPGEAKDTWLDKQVEKRKKGDPGENPEILEIEEKEAIDADERRMLFEFKQKRVKVMRESAADDLVGTVLADKYGITELIGKGNMAAVYKVKKFSDDKIYAAKTARKNASKEELERFRREILTHAKLSHDCIVRFIETVTNEEGRKFLIMESVAGISLHDVLEIHGPIEQPENIWNILSQICDALDHAHNQGVIHRDLKSGNVILAKRADEAMQVKILDFGISKDDDINDLKITNPGRSVGSPLYMSPEQCEGSALTSASDIYTLGILAYELVTGEVPYKSNSLIKVMQAHCNPEKRPESLVTRLPNVPYIDHFERIIFKTLETEPVLRIESAGELKQVLQDWIERIRRDGS